MAEAELTEGDETRSLLFARADATVGLPTLSPILDRAMRLAEGDETSATQIADLVSSDVALAAQVLRLANSAAFGVSRRVTSIRQAIVLLGFNVLKGILIGATVFDQLERTMAGLWSHSLACATAAGIISRQALHAAPEEAYTAGLLHDVGKVFWGSRCPESLVRIRSTARDQDLAMIEAETQVLGVTHAQIGRRMALAWGLPGCLVEPVAFHHDPLRASSCSVATFTVHLADCVVRAYGFDDGCTDLVLSLHPATLQKVGLTNEEFWRITRSLGDTLSSVREFI